MRSLAAEDELLDRVGALVEERDRVQEALREQGWSRVPPSEANFVWLRLGARTEEFAAACEAAGVVVRPFSGEGARVTIGEARGQRPVPPGGQGLRPRPLSRCQPLADLPIG